MTTADMPLPAPVAATNDDGGPRLCCRLVTEAREGDANARVALIATGSVA